MNKTVGILAATLLIGTSTAFAQPQQSFGDSFAQMQALSSNSSQWQQVAPVFSRQAADPAKRMSESDYQALSSESEEWQPNGGRYTSDGEPSFARTHPTGLSFSDYQALSSNSGEYKVTADANARTVAATSPRSTTGTAAAPTLRDRLASFFHRNGVTPTSMQ